MYKYAISGLSFISAAAAFLSHPLRASAPAEGDKSAGNRQNSLVSVQKTSNCARIARYLEERHGIPKGLLKAIATVESKQYPWVVNVDGRGKRFNDRAALVSYLKGINLNEVVDFYVGPMQISYRSHKGKLRTLDNFADPYTNMEYAARLLCSHKRRYGTWAKAVQYYHSAYAGYNTAYQKRVYVTWQRQENIASFEKLEAQV